LVLRKKKEKNATEEEKIAEQAGDRYSYVAIDAVTRFVIAVVSGRRVQKIADNLLAFVAIRIVKMVTILFTSDDWNQYLPAITKAFGILRRPRRKSKRGRKKKIKKFLPKNILYGIIKKIKDSSGKTIGKIRKVVHGEEARVQQFIEQSPVSKVINTSFIERMNGTFRTYCSCLIRKTYKFSKNSYNHDCHITLVTCYYNFIKSHRTLSKNFQKKTTPAMAVKITDHCWTWEELCNFLVIM
jgi:IS1 family transposase